jgi:hypothetical protein
VLIHSSVVGRAPRLLHSLNNAAVNMGVQVSLLYPDLHSFRYMLRSGIAESCGSSNFSFLRNLILFSIVVVLIYILTTVHKDSFLPSPAFIVVCVLGGCCSNRSEGES